MNSRPAAFFDLDRTLIDVNSGTLYVRHEYRAGRISTGVLARSMFWMLMYHLSLLDLDRAYGKALKQYQGLSSADLDERTRTWFRKDVLERIQPGALAAMKWHREAGHPLVLLTNSSCYVAQIATEVWSFDAWLANRFPTDSHGILTGEFQTPLCYGRGKVFYAQRWASEANVDLDQSYFYTDSLSDLPMLERVQHPRVVNPDPRLRWKARRRGWPILDWSDAERAVVD